MATYELWQMRSGNLMATFETEPAALAAVRQAMRRHGAGYAATLALGREDGRGRSCSGQPARWTLSTRPHGRFHREAHHWS